MKKLVVTLILAMTLLSSAPVGQAQAPAPNVTGSPGILLPPVPLPQGDAAKPWFAPERSGPGAVITVDTTADELNNDGNCSLREAIEAANTDAPVDACVAGTGDDTVVVPAGTYVLGIPGTDEDANHTGDLDILDNLVLTGAGEQATILNANSLDRYLQVHTGRSVTISALTVTGGQTINSPGTGIYNLGTLTLNDVELRGNTMLGGGSLGGALANDALVQNATAHLNNCLIDGNTGGIGGIQSAPNANLTVTVTVDHSTIAGNTGLVAGGLYNGSFGDGGNTHSYLTVTDSLISGNSAAGAGIGGGVFSVGYPENNHLAWLTLERTTIRDNTASNDANWAGFGTGGGVALYDTTASVLDSTVSGNQLVVLENDPEGGRGGGIFVRDSSVTIANSTISGNQVSGGVGLGGGIFVEAVVSPPSVQLLNVTLAGNSAWYGGGGICSSNRGGGAPLVAFQNTIIGGNQAALGMSCFSFYWGYGNVDFTSRGNNVEDTDYCQLNWPSDLRNTDPLIGPLADNGGPTWTHALLTGSPAINAGNDAAAPPADQRGVVRPQGPASDIGAFEAKALHLNVLQLTWAAGGSPGTYVVRATARVHDQSQLVVAGVTVTGQWMRPNGTKQRQIKTTNANGMAQFSLGTNQSDTFKFCVGSLIKAGYTYTPAANETRTCKTVVVGP